MANTRVDKQRKLTPQQELFCRFYTQNETLFGNGTLCYAESHNFKLDELSHECPCAADDHKHTAECPDSEYDLAYHTCSVNGSRALRNAEIQKRITALLNEMLRDDVVDSQLAKLILQDTEPTAKVAAIREYNKLRSRIIEKVDHTTKGKAIHMPTLIKVVELPTKPKDAE